MPEADNHIFMPEAYPPLAEKPGQNIGDIRVIFV